MNKEIIEKYIQFAIENGFKGIKYPQEVKSIGNELFDRLGLKYNLIEVITSKEFIEAIARGILRENNPENHKDFKKSDLIGIDLSKDIEKITHNQADAIRDNKLEDFILSIIK